MNFKRILFLLLSFCYFITSEAQIKVRETEAKNAPVFKPAPYDSLHPMTYHYLDKWDESMNNLSVQEVYDRNELDFKKYIGHTLYFIPLSKIATVIPAYFYYYNEKKGSYYQDEKIKAKNENSIRIRKIKVQNNKSVLKGTTFEDYINQDTINSYSLVNIYKPIKNTSNYAGVGVKIHSNNNICSSYNEIAGNYFRIIDIQNVKLKDGQYNTRDYFKFVITHEQDTLYFLTGKFAFQGADDFILVAYYEKLQKTFVGKNYIFQKEKQLSRGQIKLFPSDRNDEKGNPYVSDINTGEQIILNNGSEWKCVSLEFVEVANKNYLQLFFILKNQLGNEIIVGANGSMEDFFIEKEKYINEQELQKKEENERKRIIEEERRKREIAKESAAKENIEKYGKYYGDLINARKVVLGMNKEMCIKAWGKPMEINKTIVAGLVQEQWVYSLSMYLYFENGELTAIQH